MLSALAAWTDPRVSMVWAARIASMTLLVLISLSDFRVRRIPNRLIVVGLVVGLLWHALAPAGSGLFHGHDAGALGLASSLGGSIAAFAAFFALHRMRVMGAGDVKLMAMLGVFFGLESLPALTLLVFAVGGLLALARMFNRARRDAVLANLRVIASGALASASGSAGPQFDPARDSADRLPFALAISGGAFVFAGAQLAGVVS